MIGGLLAFIGSALYLGAQASKETMRNIENTAEAKKVASIPLNHSRQSDLTHLFSSYRKEDQELICELVKNSKCTAIGKQIAIAELDKAMQCVEYRRSKNGCPKLCDYMVPRDIDLCVWVVAQDEGWVVDKFIAPGAPTGYTCMQSVDLQKSMNQF